MESNHIRSIIAQKYHSLEVYDCPIEVLSILAENAKVDVTVENITPNRYSNDWFEAKQALYPGANISNYKFRNVTYDVSLSNAEFINHIGFWDQNGVFAVFTEKSPVVFKVSKLKEPSRYKALENFGLVLVVDLGGPSSSGWSSFISPKSELIDIAEEIIKNG